MDWENEWFVKLYTRDTADWIGLGYAAQSLLMHLFRKVDRFGKLNLGKRGARALADILCASALWETQILPALDTLIQDGCVRVEGDTLTVVNFAEAQAARASNRLRQAQWRERQKLQSTSDNETSHDVTPSNEHRNAHEQTVTIRSDQIRSETDLVGLAPNGVSVGDQKNHDPEEPPNPKAREVAERWLTWFNAEFGRRYQANRELVANVGQLLRGGYSLEDLRMVAAWVAEEWRDKADMAKYVRPSTILRPSNFRRYVVEARELLAPGDQARGAR